MKMTSMNSIDFSGFNLKHKTNDCSKQSKFMKPTYFSNKTTSILL